MPSALSAAATARPPVMRCISTPLGCCAIRRALDYTGSCTIRWGRFAVVASGSVLVIGDLQASRAQTIGELLHRFLRLEPHPEIPQRILPEGGIDCVDRVQRSPTTITQCPVGSS